MKKSNLLILSLLFLVQANLSQAQKWDKFSVLLGEKNLNEVILEKPKTCRIISIRLDGEGNYYPGIRIADKSLKKAKGKLSRWYKKHPSQYAEILKKHKIEQTDNALEILNESIEQMYVHHIDSLSKTRDIVFLIHGYRKRMYKQKDNSLSLVDNRLVEAELDSDKLFVEIYWDSKHITMFKGIWGKKGLKMMEKSAIPNAINVGIQLRSLLDAISEDKIAIITHSLGSVVTNYLTFNYDEASNFMQGKEIRTAYLAPAIGHESFKAYSERGKSQYTLKTCIGYNENDWVLLKDFKKYGVRIKANPLVYGNTSLGCNYKNDIDKHPFPTCV